MAHLADEAVAAGDMGNRRCGSLKCGTGVTVGQSTVQRTAGKVTNYRVAAAVCMVIGTASRRLTGGCPCPSPPIPRPEGEPDVDPRRGRAASRTRCGTAKVVVCARDGQATGSDLSIYHCTRPLHTAYGGGRMPRPDRTSQFASACTARRGSSDESAIPGLGAPGWRFVRPIWT